MQQQESVAPHFSFTDEFHHLRISTMYFLAYIQDEKYHPIVNYEIAVVSTVLKYVDIPCESAWTMVKGNLMDHQVRLANWLQVVDHSQHPELVAVFQKIIDRFETLIKSIPFPVLSGMVKPIDISILKKQ